MSDIPTTIAFHRFTAALALLASLLILGCSPDAATPLAPSSASGVSAAPGTSDPVTATSTASPDLAPVLVVALQDEYHAQAVYERVLLDFGSVFPFVNIVRAERAHAASIEGLFQVRGLDVPVSAWNLDNVPRFASVREACGAAAQAELDNAAVYDRYPADTLPADVARVFANNRAASLNNHLQAFNACR
jgi:hypothetical protein